MRTITVITKDADGIFQSVVIDGLQSIATQQDFQIRVITTGGVNTASDQINIACEQTAGIVVIANAVSDDFLQQMVQKAMPITLVSHRHPELPIPAVMSDDAQGIKAVMRHLVIRCERRSPVFIRGIPEQLDSMRREKAFRRELLRHNIPVENSAIISGEFSAEIAATAIQQLLGNGFVFDCLIAADYVMGIAAIKTLHRAGIRVPADVSVVGYGDDHQAESAGLTTVSANIRELGQRAARQIISQINGLQISGTTTISVELIIRDSCGCFSDGIKS